MLSSDFLIITKLKEIAQVADIRKRSTRDYGYTMPRN